MKVVRAGTSGSRLEMVFLQQIEYRDRPFMLDIGAAADDRMLVEGDAGNPPGAFRVAHTRRFIPRPTGRAEATVTKHGPRALPPRRAGLPAVRAPQGSRHRSGRASCASENREPRAPTQSGRCGRS